ncbi:MAG: 50S ribosomal protein L3 [Candidatus Gottesmanbacteria bacterium]
MLKAILGIKQKQTQTFTEDGMRHSVTHIEAGPCWITQIDTTATYTNVQLGFKTKRAINKPLEGHIKKAGLTQKFRFLRSIRVDDIPEDWKVGREVIISDVFAVGDVIRVTGISKGKGFAGVVKRHGFAGGPKTHGQSDKERSPGSIGATTTPGRVFKGKRMAGRMGGETVTVKGLKVIAIDAEHRVLVVSGLVPGPKDSFVIVKKEA